MPMPDSLREAYEAWKIVKDKASDELQALLKQNEGQLERLQELFGSGTEEAQQKLEEMASKGAEAIPDGLRQDVIEAYNRLAQVYVDAEEELKPWIDSPGVQATRLLVTEEAARLLASSGSAGAGTSAFAAWWASLSTAAAVAVVAAGVALIAAGVAALYFGVKAYQAKLDQPQDFGKALGAKEKQPNSDANNKLSPAPPALPLSPPPVVVDTQSFDDSISKLNDSIKKMNRSMKKLQQLTDSRGPSQTPTVSNHTAGVDDLSGIWDCTITTSDGYSASARISYTLIGPDYYRAQYVSCISGDCEGIIEPGPREASLATLRAAGLPYKICRREGR
jgi:hypothetical protein